MWHDFTRISAQRLLYQEKMAGTEEAQQKFIELIKAANFEPQIIYQQERPLADMFAKLRQSCLEENYILKTPLRHNRSNPF